MGLVMTSPSRSHTDTQPPWHGNWYREWSIGRFAFEIEWVPRGHCYTFTFSINSTKKQLERMGM